MRDIGKYLDGKNIEWRRRGEQAIFNCPSCGDKERKFGVSLISGAFNCLHQNNCGIKGSFSQLQKLFGDEPTRWQRDAFVNTTAKAYTRPKTEIKPATQSVMDYMDKRGLIADVREYFKIGAFDNDTVMLPYYRNGELVNIKYRSISDKKKMRTEKDAEPSLFNRDNIKDRDKLVICEGEYDAMALHRYLIEAVSVPMGAGNMQWIDTEWDYLETFKEIYLCLDSDPAGKKAARNIAAKLGEWRCRIVSLPAKDANECLLKKLPISTEWDRSCSEHQQPGLPWMQCSRDGGEVR
jgi:DNA primase